MDSEAKARANRIAELEERIRKAQEDMGKYALRQFCREAKKAAEEKKRQK